MISDSDFIERDTLVFCPVLFSLLKAYARFALWIACRRITVNKPDWLQASGPLLLACNHPNSFLDGIILTTLFKRPVYSLARGDAFRNPKFRQILYWLRLLPVYRTSEGVENLGQNYSTFDACLDIFKRDGIVIIFSEGGTRNEWRLRPLRKGTGRLATAAWQENIPLNVLPVGLNYNPPRSFGKNILVQFGQPLQVAEVMEHCTDGKMLLAFNEQLERQLSGLVYEIAPGDRKRQSELVFVPQPIWRKAALAVPAAFGFLVHTPLYFPAKVINRHYFDNDHFDSTLFSILALAYPLYLALIAIVTGCLWSWIAAAVAVVLLPVTAWACVQVKGQL